MRSDRRTELQDVSFKYVRWLSPSILFIAFRLVWTLFEIYPGFDRSRLVPKTILTISGLLWRGWRASSTRLMCVICATLFAIVVYLMDLSITPPSCYWPGQMKYSLLLIGIEISIRLTCFNYSRIGRNSTTSTDTMIQTERSNQKNMKQLHIDTLNFPLPKCVSIFHLGSLAMIHRLASCVLLVFLTGTTTDITGPHHLLSVLSSDTISQLKPTT